MARSLGRFDWWNIKAEHTSYQWRCQLAMYAVEPWGESRADLRSAVNTANHIVSTAMAKIPDEVGQQLFQMLRNYLEHNQDNEDTVDLAAVEKVKEQNGQ